MIPLYKPFFPRGSMAYAKEALASGWVSWQGKYLKLTEEKLKELFGFEHVLLTSSGTAAVHLMSMVWQRLNFDSLTFPENCYVGAVNPFLLKVPALSGEKTELSTYPLNYNTWNGSPPRIKRISDATLIVHNLGNVFNVVDHFTGDERTSVFEDACEALGGKYYDQYVGTASLCAAFSFYASKTITCGEGGAFVCRDPSIYKMAKSWSTQGQSSQRYLHDSFGLNYRMTNVQAAMLLGQLEYWDELQERKEDVYLRYRSRLKNVSHQVVTDNTKHSYWMTGVRVHGSKGYKRARQFFDEAGIEIRPFFYPLNHHLHLKMVPMESQYQADNFSREIILLPSYPELALEEKDKQDYIIEKVEQYASSFRE